VKTQIYGILPLTIGSDPTRTFASRENKGELSSSGTAIDDPQPTSTKPTVALGSLINYRCSGHRAVFYHV